MTINIHTKKAVKTPEVACPKLYVQFKLIFQHSTPKTQGAWPYVTYNFGQVFHNIYGLILPYLSINSSCIKRRLIGMDWPKRKHSG